MTKPVSEIRSEVEYLDAELDAIINAAEGRALDADAKTRFDEGLALREQLAAEVNDYETRMAATRTALANGTARIEAGGGFHAPEVIVRNNPFDLSDLSLSSTAGEVRSKAFRAVEVMEGLSDADRTKAEQVIRSADTIDAKVSKHVIATSSPEYRSAFSKLISERSYALTPEEVRSVELARAASLTGNAGGYVVPTPLDPTIIDTRSGTANPLRQISRVVQTTANTWNGVSSAGVTASWDAEGAEVSDDAPTLAQPSITCYKGAAFVPFSIEIGADWQAIESDVRMMIVNAKDDLEATAFATGSSSAPQGIVTALTGGSYIVNNSSSETFVVGDVYALEEALGPRYRANASFIANKAIYNKVRQFDTYGGAGMWERIGAGQPAQLLGYNAYEASAMDGAWDASATAHNYVMVLGDFSNYVIVDRIGLSVELVPHLLHTSNNLPNGKRGFYAYWRVGADSVNDAAFRMLDIVTAA